MQDSVRGCGSGYYGIKCKHAHSGYLSAHDPKGGGITLSVRIFSYNIMDFKTKADVFVRWFMETLSAKAKENQSFQE